MVAPMAARIPVKPFKGRLQPTGATAGSPKAVLYPSEETCHEGNRKANHHNHNDDQHHRQNGGPQKKGEDANREPGWQITTYPL